MTKQLLALAGCGVMVMGSAQAVTLTFDTDAADNSAFIANYNGFAVNGPDNVSVSGGVLTITKSTAGVTSTSVTRSGINGDAIYSVDLLGNSGAIGGYNIGITIGANSIVFHPGFGGAALRVEGDGGFTNTNVGFTPAVGTAHRLEIRQTASTGQYDITLRDGGNNANVFNTSFTNLASVGQDVGLRLSSGGVASASFDNFQVTAVPEPSSTALLGLGGLSLLLRRRR